MAFTNYGLLFEKTNKVKLIIDVKENIFTLFEFNFPNI